MSGYRTPVDDDRDPMTLGEVSRWASLVVIVGSTIAYGVAVLPQLATTDPADIDWQIPMLWAMGASIVGAIVLSILLAIATAIVARREPEGPDIRDKEIERYGDRVAQSVLAFGTIAVLVLAMLEVDWFWIGNTAFFLGAVGAVVGGIVSIRAYHGAFRG